MHDIGSWCDRIGTEEKAFTAFLGGCNQSPSGGFVARDGGILTRRERVGLLDSHRLDIEGEIVSVVETIGEHFDVRCDELGFLLELTLKESNCLIDRTREKPTYQSESKHIAGFEHRLIV